MDDNAARWLQVYKLQYGLTDWLTFIAAVEKQFGSYDYRDAIGELVALHQYGTLDDYITTITDLQYQVQMHNQGLDEIYFVTQFVKGLTLELAAGVQSQAPKKVKKAIMLAKIQQQLLDSKQLKYGKYNGRNNNFVPKFDSKPSQSNGGLWKERQLRNFRKASGLCIYCGDKYNTAHAASCTKRPQPQVNVLMVNDLDTELTEETLNQLAIEDTIAKDLQKLSINAIAGIGEGDVLKLKAMVKNKVMLILLDSGRSHSFVSSSFLKKVGIISEPMSPKKVKVANGHTMLTDKIVPQLQWWCQGHTLTTAMQVLDLGAYDAILGYDWLKPHSPMFCN
jgi:hypothetical protein